MYIKAIKLERKKLMIFAAVIAMAAAVAAFALTAGKGSGASVQASGKASISLKGETAKQRSEFLHSFGWEVSEDPTEITEVLIPTEFDKTYEQYNVLQKKQGFDLSRYRGKRVKMWTYAVTNYPGETGGVHATLLIYDGEIIGGDISSDEQNKFTHGFEPQS